MKIAVILSSGIQKRGRRENHLKIKIRGTTVIWDSKKRKEREPFKN